MTISLRLKLTLANQHQQHDSSSRPVRSKVADVTAPFLLKVPGSWLFKNEFPFQQWSTFASNVSEQTSPSPSKCKCENILQNPLQSHWKAACSEAKTCSASPVSICGSREGWNLKSCTLYEGSMHNKSTIKYRDLVKACLFDYKINKNKIQ